MVLKGSYAANISRRKYQTGQITRVQDLIFLDSLICDGAFKACWGRQDVALTRQQPHGTKQQQDPTAEPELG